MTGHPFGIQVTTALTAAQLEDWLTQNCRGSYSLNVVDVTPDLTKKIFAVFFETEHDREVFRAGYRQIR
ncbi:MAG: hypothetical protein A2516_05195 [Alphaproteobacteria bacterium RIFOXYD12_FULL_60_8]|nr:MAG: hypothetical protein A2516_05195 [Alphaproteobacteria bacterium RIFOXYD12_FULL_60_8]